MKVKVYVKHCVKVKSVCGTLCESEVCEGVCETLSESKGVCGTLSESEVCKGVCGTLCESEVCETLCESEVCMWNTE